MIPIGFKILRFGQDLMKERTEAKLDGEKKKSSSSRISRLTNMLLLKTR